MLANPGGYLYKAVDDDMADTLSAGGILFPNPRVHRVGRKNHVFFPAPEGGHIRQTKNTISVVTNRGTTRYTRGAYSHSMDVPKGIKKTLKPGQNGTMFARSDLMHSGDHYFDDEEEAEYQMGEHMREDETHSLSKGGFTMDERAAKRDSYRAFKDKWKDTVLYAVDFPAPAKMKLDYHQTIRARESRKTNPPAWAKK